MHSVTEVHNGRNGSRNCAQFFSAQKSFSVKKAAELLNFCLIGKILHNFPMPISIEPAPKSFICIQILLWYRVTRVAQDSGIFIVKAHLKAFYTKISGGLGDPSLAYSDLRSTCLPKNKATNA